MLDNGHGGKVFTPLADVYNGYLDDAITGMANGAYDYNALVPPHGQPDDSLRLRTDHPSAMAAATTAWTTPAAGTIVWTWPPAVLCSLASASSPVTSRI